MTCLHCKRMYTFPIPWQNNIWKNLHNRLWNIHKHTSLNYILQLLPVCITLLESRVAVLRCDKWKITCISVSSHSTCLHACKKQKYHNQWKSMSWKWDHYALWKQMAPISQWQCLVPEEWAPAPHHYKPTNLDERNISVFICTGVSQTAGL